MSNTSINLEETITLPSPAPAQWLVNRISNLSASPPRYEASWYGLHNALLNHFFPYPQKFLVKPQSKLRPPYETNTNEPSKNKQEVLAGQLLPADLPKPADVSDGYEEEHSFSSVGVPVVPRSFGGTEVSIYIPDFVVAKATENIDADTTLLHIEIEVNNDARKWRDAKNQLFQFIERHLETENYGTYGLIICGGDAEMYLATSASRKIRRFGKRCSVNDPRIRNFLYTIASRNWNEVEVALKDDDEDDGYEDDGYEDDLYDDDEYKYDEYE